jgi:carbonic anhydrase/acetyltransferase-like protein (isoleucine patch superfamily)
MNGTTNGTTNGLPAGNIYPFEGKVPRVADDAFIAPTATLIGDVVVEAGASVWFGAVLRGDFNRIVVGAGTTVQDNSVIHTNAGAPTIIGENVTVGHLSMLEACEVGDGALVGMGSIVLNFSKVGEHAMLAAGTVVREGQEIPPRVLAAGTPAKIKKELDGSAARWVETAALEYQSLRLKYMGVGSGESGVGENGGAGLSGTGASSFEAPSSGNSSKGDS